MHLVVYPPNPGDQSGEELPETPPGVSVSKEHRGNRGVRHSDRRELAA